MTKYIAAGAFGLWLGWCLNGLIEGVSKEHADYRQRVERLEERVKKLEKPLYIEPKQEQTA